ncbi:hypothetical protein, partial [Neisseria dentiae]|uniref:hypothetical protein n=1 Tax=Neisseria dentiae TaxID=194197 RepID=UPI00359F9092
ETIPGIGNLILGISRNTGRCFVCISISSFTEFLKNSKPEAPQLFAEIGYMKLRHGVIYMVCHLLASPERQFFNKI